MENDVVLVGKKPLMSYVLAVLTHLNSGHDSITIKARGMMISKAVDVSQVVIRKFSQGLKVTNIQIGTEELQGKTPEEKRNVSFISIEMKK